MTYSISTGYNRPVQDPLEYSNKSNQTAPHPSMAWQGHHYFLSVIVWLMWLLLILI